MNHFNYATVVSELAAKSKQVDEMRRHYAAQMTTFNKTSVGLQRDNQILRDKFAAAQAHIYKLQEELRKSEKRSEERRIEIVCYQQSLQDTFKQIAGPVTVESLKEWFHNSIEKQREFDMTKLAILDSEERVKYVEEILHCLKKSKASPYHIEAYASLLREIKKANVDVPPQAPKTPPSDAEQPEECEKDKSLQELHTLVAKPSKKSQQEATNARLTEEKILKNLAGPSMAVPKNVTKWRVAVDPESTRPYWWNVESRSTQWQVPDDICKLIGKNRSTIAKKITRMKFYDYQPVSGSSTVELAGMSTHDCSPTTKKRKV